MIRLSAAALVLAVAVTQPVSAQLATSSTASLGMGDNFTGVARGFSAIAWNPANLGLTGNPGSSFQFLTLRGIAGVDPVTLKDIKDYQGKVVPTEVKQSWLDQINTEGSQQGTSGFDGNWLSLQIGKLGFQASTSGRAVANISPGIARLLLFAAVRQHGCERHSAEHRSVEFRDRRECIFDGCSRVRGSCHEGRNIALVGRHHGQVHDGSLHGHRKSVDRLCSCKSDVCDTALPRHSHSGVG
jgi:hypothetical protein